MSVANEVIMARALDMNVLGLTLATNESGESSVTHEAVLAEAGNYADDFERLVRGILRLL
jgi:purine-nucleoside phosphorylase